MPRLDEYSHLEGVGRANSHAEEARRQIGPPAGAGALVALFNAARAYGKTLMGTEGGTVGQLVSLPERTSGTAFDSLLKCRAIGGLVTGHKLVKIMHQQRITTDHATAMEFYSGRRSPAPVSPSLAEGQIHAPEHPNPC